jgi:hypothetical protein
MVREVVVYPEMLKAGIEAMEESRGQSVENAVLAVFLAMRAIEEVAGLRLASELVH